LERYLTFKINFTHTPTHNYTHTMNNITVSNITLAALLALKPKAFWSLESDVLTASIPLLQAERDRVEALRAESAKTQGYYTDSAYQDLWNLSWKLDGWIEKARSIPKKRIVDAEKAARAKAREDKSTGKAEQVRLITPAANLIIASLSKVAEYIESRHYAAHLGGYKRVQETLEKYIAANPVTERVVTSGNHTWTVREGKDWYDFVKESFGKRADIRRELYIHRDASTQYHVPLADLARQPVEVADKILKKDAKDHADFVVKTYAFRVAERTVARHHRATNERQVTITASHSDNDEVWDGALITVTAGAHQYQFKTKAITNFSKYGKAFSQFPTREIASSHEDASTLGDW
jgi:hypothetical protein